MSNTNLLAVLQQERVALIEMVAYLLHKSESEVDLVTDVSTLGDIIVIQSDELGMIDYRGYKDKLTALESELAAAVEALQPFAEQDKHIQEIVKRKGKVYFNPELSLHSVQATSYLDNIGRSLKLKHIHNAAEIVTAYRASRQPVASGVTPSDD
jgi:hypothetical protein